MVSRSTTREYTNVLVLFDDSLQKVVTRSKILTDGRVRVGERYEVIWGTPTQADQATVLATGEWLDLTKQMHNNPEPDQQRKRKISESSISPEQSPEPQPKKKSVTVQKPEATLIATGPADATPTQSSTSPTSSPRSPTPPGTPSTSNTPIPTRTPILTQLTPTTPIMKTPLPMMVNKLNQKMDVMNKRLLTIEMRYQKTEEQQQQIQSTLDKILHLLQRDQPSTSIETQMEPMPPPIPKPTAVQPLDIQQPPPVPISTVQTPTLPVIPTPIAMPLPSSLPSAPSYNSQPNIFTFDVPPMPQPQFNHLPTIPEHQRLSHSQLERTYHSTKGPGNFAQHLVRLLYPELFTFDNHRLNYSVNGGGRLDKHKLSPTRLNHIQQYVCLYYPEMQIKNAFKAAVYPKINECLRRPADKPKSKD